MRYLSSFVFLVCFLMIAGLAFAQQPNDPITGKWTGDWGPNAYDRNGVTVDLKWDGKTVTGSVSSDRAEPVSISKGAFDAKAGSVHLEADAKRNGQTVHYVIDGKLDKNMLSGSWNHDNRQGDFKITKK